MTFQQEVLLESFVDLSGQNVAEIRRSRVYPANIALVSPFSPYKKRKKFSVDHIKKCDLVKKLSVEQQAFVSALMKQNIELQTDPKDPCLINEKMERTWLIPGVGKKGVNCQNWLPKTFCPGCGSVQLIHGTCNSPQCPNCSTRHRYRRAASAFMRLFTYKIDHKKRLQHCIVSLSEKQARMYFKEKQRLSWLYRDLYRFLKNKKVEGGWVLFHPYRIIAEKKRELYDLYDQYHDTGMGEFALWKVLSKIKNWKDFVYFSPHYHIVGSTNHSDKAKKSDKFVFKRAGDLYLPDDIFKCVMYLLSHMGVHTKHKVHNIRWYGEISNGKWSVKKATEKTQKYAYHLIRELNNEFSLLEGANNGKNCTRCDCKLMIMDLLPQYIKEFKGKKRHDLLYCYQWYKGHKPPPDTDKLFRMLE